MVPIFSDYNELSFKKTFKKWSGKSFEKNILFKMF